jgi:hypothetical protein
MIEYKTLFDSFNARNLTFEQVAETFIENEHFEKLIMNSHSLLMGPRGCGKTTLLKMLTPKALYTYSKRQNSNLFYSIPFFAIYIPTDIQWRVQIESFETYYKDFPTLVKFIPKGLININVYNSLLETFVHLIDTIPQETQIDLKSLEISLSNDLIRIFELDDCVSPSFFAIEASILARISKINLIVNQTSTVYQTDKSIPIPNYCFENFIDKVREACFAFENYFSYLLKPFKTPYKWALCFDELEIAPNWLQIDLFKYLRSKNQNFIFKLTSAPTIFLESQFDTSSPTTIDDYTSIRIWISNKMDFSNWQVFCDKLISDKLQRKLGLNIKVQDLFGDFSYENALVSEGKYNKKHLDLSFYEKDSIYLKEFIELAQKDMSFKQYLKDKSIDISSLDHINTKDKDEVFRKIKPYVIYRNYFIKSFDQIKARFRTRNIPNPFYFGWDDICNVSDGNPRTIIGIVNLMIPLIEFDKYNSIKVIPYNHQAKILYQISKKYMDVWSTNPNSNLLITDQIYSLRKLISSIGEYFRNEILKEKFTPNPKGTFSVDGRVNHKLLNLINLGLFLGAIVYLNPSDNDISAGGLLDKRFRLSFLLYPYFKIPNRLESDTTILSHILASDHNQTATSIELFS